MAYSELVKNFERVRAYMRDFYVYGFKSRGDFDAKSGRSYDDERRRIESWLEDYMGFAWTAEGKTMFLSVDSRTVHHNPFYKAWKAKSFTDGDITLHFILFDILHDPCIQMTVSELAREIDGYLSAFEEPMSFDESTIRKKLKEYVDEGIICMEKDGRRVLYSRAEDTDISHLTDVINFFSEAAPVGVVGSFLEDKLPPHREIFTFKHHYMTQAMDSDVMAVVFDAMQEGRYIAADYMGKHTKRRYSLRLVPLKLYISVQNGRQNLIAYDERRGKLSSYRLEYLSHVELLEPCGKIDDLRTAFARVEPRIWGVNCKWDTYRLEHVEFDIVVRPYEQFILQRLEREKRCGRVEQIDDLHYRYTADVFDTAELIPWIRSYISRITRLHFSNRTVENRFREDLEERYRLYGLDGGNGNDIQ